MTDRDFTNISPTARGLLLMKAVTTSIPYLKQSAELIMGQGGIDFECRYLSIDQVLADQSFDRVAHTEILGILERHRSIDYALASAYRYADLARALVADLPESDERRALLWMPDFVVARDK